MKQFELSDFSPHVGTVFSFSITLEMPSMLATAGNTSAMRKEERHEDLALTKAEAFELSPRDKRAADITGKIRLAPFHLWFEGEHEQFLPQGNYKVSHPAFTEELEIFMTCLGPTENKKGYQYEVVFG